jgi:hypothetical protein
VRSRNVQRFSCNSNWKGELHRAPRLWIGLFMTRWLSLYLYIFVSNALVLLCREQDFLDLSQLRQSMGYRMCKSKSFQSWHLA